MPRVTRRQTTRGRNASRPRVSLATAWLPCGAAVSEEAKEEAVGVAAEMEAKVLDINGVKMPFWYTTYGKKPKGGRSLWISMHGGGGAPERVNTQQWQNQKRLYTPAEGVYLAPRAPTDTWNLWHQGHIDGLFDRLIENMIVFEDVDP